MAASGTTPAARPLRSSKRKSGGSVADFQSDAVEQGAEPASSAPAAAAREPMSKRRKLPVRTRADDAIAADTTEKSSADGAEQEADENDEDNSGSGSGSGSDSDSDDAPEAISTTQAVAATRQSAQRASKAAEKLAADQRRRRQDRDARLKEQAATRKERQAKKDEEAKVEAAAAAAAAAAAEAAETTAEEKATKTSVSKLLPLEFLESDDDMSDDEDADGTQKQSTAAVAVAQRRRAANKPPPRDVRQGSTVYRLLTDGGSRALAPKLRKHSRHMRQELLTRKRTGRPISRGFLLKR